MSTFRSRRRRGARPRAELAAPTADEADASQSKGIDAAAIVAATNSDPADVESDVRRKPVELLECLSLEPGMKVADIGAGFGYTTELLAPRALSKPE